MSIPAAIENIENALAELAGLGIDERIVDDLFQACDRLNRLLIEQRIANPPIDFYDKARHEDRQKRVIS